MDAETEHLELLSDAVDRVIASPCTSHCWENLMALSRGIRQVAVRDAIVQLLRARVADEGLPAFHRALYLDLATGDPQHLADAAQALLGVVPFDADRLSRFHYMAWQRVLMRNAAGAGLADQLAEVGLPTIAARLGAALARIAPGRLMPRQTSPTGPLGPQARVAVVAPYLLSARHPPTAMALDQCAVLARQGLVVELFACQEPAGPGFEHLMANGSGAEHGAAQLPAPDAAGTGSPRKIHVADVRFSLLRRCVAMLDCIAAFDPELVLFVGLQSTLMHYLYAARPVVGLCVNSIPPLVPADVFLTTHHAWHGQVQQPWSEALPASLAWHHPWRLPRKTAAQALPRAALQLDDSHVVLVTVGSLLGTRIAGPWAAAMAEALQRHPQLVWLLVGDEGQCPAALAQVPAHRLRLLPHSNDVPSLLASSDIYAHPPVVGGGFAVAEAMSHGLAVLALAGADGGDKLGSDAVADDTAYFALLDRLARDGPARRARGLRHQKHFAQMLDLAQSGPGLLAAGNAALDRFRQRTGFAA